MEVFLCLTAVLFVALCFVVTKLKMNNHSAKIEFVQDAQKHPKHTDSKKVDRTRCPFHRAHVESAVEMIDKLSKTMGELRTQSLGAGGEPYRDAGVLEYLEGRLGKRCIMELVYVHSLLPASTISSIKNGPLVLERWSTRRNYYIPPHILKDTNAFIEIQTITPSNLNQLIQSGFVQCRIHINRVSPTGCTNPWHFLGTHEKKTNIMLGAFVDTNIKTMYEQYLSIEGECDGTQRESRDSVDGLKKINHVK